MKLQINFRLSCKTIGIVCCLACLLYHCSHVGFEKHTLNTELRGSRFYSDLAAPFIICTKKKNTLCISTTGLVKRSFTNTNPNQEFLKCLSIRASNILKFKIIRFSGKSYQAFCGAINKSGSQRFPFTLTSKCR